MSEATPKITTLEQLHRYLYSALRLEHATIPPYLTALYSLHPETNSDARHVLRVVAVEEMLHLSLAANVLNATGGTPDLTRAGFVPPYPTFLPDGEKDFKVDLAPFSEATLDTFLKIERPAKAPTKELRLVPRARSARHLLAADPDDPDMQYYSIGEFYAEIERGLEYLHAEYQAEGRTLFVGDPSHQITPEYFYSGGGEAIPVTDLKSGLAALGLIAAQGEGLGGGIYDGEGELAHYYRFQQIKLQQYYQKGDQPGQPSGPPVAVDWHAVYPSLPNATLAAYPDGSELRAAAVGFNESYADFLGLLTRAYTGQPELLLEAVWRMFQIRDHMNRLLRNPLPGSPGVNAAPTFEIFAAPLVAGA
ncbi:MAG TPA: ferritin-like protein [Mycobacteriales bacterium]|nr:ferritin-like protein [Mycobacteriales bacterium]